jgi:hypothetical protein
LNDLQWSDDKKTLKLLFLIGDAGPNQNDNGPDWRAEARSAIGRGIQINTLGCQGLESFAEDQGVGVFKEIAKLSDGKYDSLAYRTEIVNAEGKTETVISSAGSLYRVSDKAAPSAWRAGAAALKARGDAEALPVSARVMTKYASRSRGGAMMESASSGEEYMGGFGGGAPMSVGAMVPPSVSRKDNNLSDAIFNVTKEAAAKKLNVEYKD